MVRVKYARIALSLTAFLALWYFTPPAAPRFHLCGFRWLTGHPCALCGMTRAMFALAKGHVLEAERFNALAPLGFAMVFASLLGLPIRGKIWMAGIASFAVYGICRIIM
jgi:hypothetical protein